MEPLSIPIEQYRLENGLTVLLHHTPDAPVVTLEVMYHVGSKNENPGRTGLAHLFEHIMFKGSAHVPDGGHFKQLQEIGAEVNGSTTEDRTTYYEVVPPDHLELALSLEADRMAYLLPALTEAKLLNQRDVVKNERRQSYENQPYGLVQETLSAALFPPDHPYSWPVIGSMQDLDNATLEDLRDFFTRFYHPANAVVAIGGRFQPDAARSLVRTYFGEITSRGKGNSVALPSWTHAGPQTITLYDNVALPRVYLAWRSAPWFSDGDIALDVATDILGTGKNSRLHKSLVIEQQLAQSVTAYQHGMECDGKVIVAATARQDVDPARLIAALREVVAHFLSDVPEKREFQKALNIKESGLIFGLDAVRDRVHQLALLHTLTGSAGHLAEYPLRYSRLDPASLASYAAHYLVPEPVVLTVLPGRQA
jgi:zinc protease